MTKVALFVRLRAKPGKKASWRSPRRSPSRRQAEPQTPVWFALRFGPTSSAFSMRFPTKGQEGAPQRPHRRRADEARGRALVGAAKIEQVDLLASKVQAELVSAAAGMLRVV